MLKGWPITDDINFSSSESTGKSSPYDLTVVFAGFPICASESPFRTHPKSLAWSRVTRISNPYHQQPLVTPNARLRNYPIIPIDGFALMEAVGRTLTVSPVIAIFLAPGFSLTSTNIIGRTSDISFLIVIVMRDIVTVVFPCVEYNKKLTEDQFCANLGQITLSVLI